MRSRISSEPSALDLQFIHALELVHDAEPFADHLHGGARAARGGFPAAEDEQLGFVEAGDGLDGLGQGGGDFGGLGESAGRAVERDEFERHLLGDGHHDLLELGLRAEADQPDFAAGRVLGEVRRFVKRVAGPRVEDSRAASFHFSDAGPAGPVTGSRVWSGSGTMLPQTTIWYAMLINQTGNSGRRARIWQGKSILGR